MPKISIVHTATGPHFARRIARSLKWRFDQGRCKTAIETDVLSVNQLSRIAGDSGTLIHARAAHPRTRWMNLLESIERDNLVVNSTQCLRLTSDKLRSSLLFARELPEFHPRTWEHTRGDDVSELPPGEYIIKPYTSMSQGAHVRRYSHPTDSIRDVEAEVPGRVLILQECVPYTALHRVIVIDGVPLPYTFVDVPTPDRWRVSVCLNKTTMEFVNSPSQDLLALGVRAQEIVGGDINFIDIFETRNGFVLGEINTACNLRIHEVMARDYGRRDWNIHYKIARYLEGRVLNA